MHSIQLASLLVLPPASEQLHDTAHILLTSLSAASMATLWSSSLALVDLLSTSRSATDCVRCSELMRSRSSAICVSVGQAAVSG